MLAATQICISQLADESRSDHHIRCNAASAKVDLYGIYSQVSTQHCPGSYHTSKYQIDNVNAIMSIKQGEDSPFRHQTSSWTFGVPPPTLHHYLTSQDTSSPGCLFVRGIIQVDLCPVEGPWSDVQFLMQSGFCTSAAGVQAKYFGSICAGKASQADAYSWDFVASTEDLTYNQCFEFLDARSSGFAFCFCLSLTPCSSFQSHCATVSGRYGLTYTLTQRRALLPDCCVSLSFCVSGRITAKPGRIRAKIFRRKGYL
eukprot:757416-Hanusia_phi.AAC.4